jgi:DNA repair exonuclease SbcCD ATPase subunit
MITLKKMRWSNLFSYGENNELDFSTSPLTQIVGRNGHGKSSIALILEEVLYNKNSKGIKKADILNRNVKAKNYSVELEFDKDGSSYVIKTVRGATQTVKLTCDGEDISSHTSTATYKTIEELIGYDHKTFCQIVYQSSSASLEFLTATDGNRKKFLIDLLNLTKYVELGDVFKDLAKGVDNAVTAAEEVPCFGPD